MSLTVKGTPDFRNGPLSPLFSVPKLSFQGVSRRKTPFGGEKWVLTYEGPAANNPEEPSPAEEGYNQVPLDFEAQLDAIGPIYRLTVTTPDFPSGGSAGVQNTYYEVVGDEIQVDLREHPKALALGPSRVEVITKVVEGQTSAGGHVYVAADVIGEIDGLVALTGDSATDATTLYGLLRQRNNNAVHYLSRYVFRYSQIASIRAAVTILGSGTHHIYTTTQMLTETGPPSGVVATVSEAAGVAAAELGTVPTGYAFGWLKKTPTVTVEAGNLYRVSGEYVLYIWSTWEYPTV